MHNIGDSYLREQNYSKAVDYFKQALTIKKGSELFITFMDLGTCYDHLGHAEKAMSHYQKAAALFSQVEPYRDNIEVFKKMHHHYRAKEATEYSYAASDRYIAELETFTDTKEQQAARYAAAQFQARLDLHDKWTYATQIFRDYQLWLWGLGIAIIVISFVGVMQYRRFIRARKDQIEVKETAQEIHEDVLTFLNNL